MFRNSPSIRDDTKAHRQKTDTSIHILDRNSCFLLFLKVKLEHVGQQGRTDQKETKEKLVKSLIISYCLFDCFTDVEICIATASEWTEQEKKA